MPHGLSSCIAIGKANKTICVSFFAQKSVGKSAVMVTSFLNWKENTESVEADKKLVIIIKKADKIT